MGENKPTIGLYDLTDPSLFDYMFKQGVAGLKISRLNKIPEGTEKDLPAKVIVKLSSSDSYKDITSFVSKYSGRVGIYCPPPCSTDMAEEIRGKFPNQVSVFSGLKSTWDLGDFLKSLD